MEEWRRKKIEDVYAKWEKKGSRPEPSRQRDPQPQASSKKQSRSLVIRSSRYSSASNGRSTSWNRRKNKDASLAAAVTPSFVPSLGIDLSSLRMANNLKYSSLRGSCPRCLPTSQEDVSASDNEAAGLFNFLIVDQRKFKLFGRLFPYVTHTWGTVTNYSLRDLREDTLQSKRVAEAIEACAKAASEDGAVSYSVAQRKQRERAVSIIGSMSSSVYNNLARLVAWALLVVFNKLFTRILVSRSHASMLLRAQEQGVPIVFLPSHKSHMDYIIMTFVLFNMGVRIPRIAAGDNLKIPFISWLVTHLGGFFIKRKLDTAAGKDILYRKCLHEFMEQSLRDGENMEFFIEGSRSRSGKVCSPKAGLLSVLVNSVKEGVVDDILIVPVGISYDMIVERNFIRHELMGGNKKPETFWKAMGGVWSMLTRNIGAIKIDFARPFSLQEYLTHSTISSQSQPELTNASHYRSILNMSSVTERKVITALSQHIVHDITHCASLMATNMVAFLLMTKHRDGVTVTDLISSYRSLEEIAIKKERAVGFAGECSEAVHYALHYLAPLLTFDDHTLKGRGSISGDQVVRPRLQLPDVFELMHHTNQVTPMLLLEAVIACSLGYLVGSELRLVQGGREAVEVDKDEVLDAATFLCKILAREFIFAPPCVDVWSALSDTLDSMINEDILKIPSELNSAPATKKLPSYLFNESEDEEESYSVRVQINTEKWALKHLEFLQNILSPFLEGYWNTMVALLQMETATEETEFLKNLHDSLMNKAERNVLRNVESCSMDTLRNGVKSMVDLGLISYKKGTHLHMADHNRLMEILQRMTDFKN